MPILHRNVVPNVPSWTADNGKIIHNAGGISHRAEMRLSISFGGYISFGPTVTARGFPATLTVPTPNLWKPVRFRPYGQLEFFYNDAARETVGGVAYRVRRTSPDHVHFTFPGDDGPYDDGQWRIMAAFLVAWTQYGSPLDGEFRASLFKFAIAHTWDAAQSSVRWCAWLNVDSNDYITPSLCDPVLFPNGAAGYAPFTLYQRQAGVGDELVAALLVNADAQHPDASRIIKFESADEWPTDGFRLGGSQRLVYAGPAGRGMDLSNLYMDVKTEYAA